MLKATIGQWMVRVPRAVIALALVVPLVWLSLDSFGWQRTCFELAIVAWLYAAGGIQRRNTRQTIGMAGLGLIMYGVGKAVTHGVGVIAPNVLWLRLGHVGILLVGLGVGEWLCVWRTSKGVIPWLLLSCLGAAALIEVVASYALLADWRITTGSLEDPPFRSQPVVSLIFWPLLTVLGWTTVSASLAASISNRRDWKVFTAFFATCCFVLYGWFYVSGVYSLAATSVAGNGPFSRGYGAAVLESRGSPADFDMLWQQVCEGTEDEVVESPNYGWRRYFLEILITSDPERTAGRVVEQLHNAPKCSLAESSAELLVKQKRYGAAPELMRYALLGDQNCTQALEQMRVPQVAAAWICQAEILAIALTPGVIPITSNPEGILLDGRNRSRLARVLGKDVGSDIADWDALYREVASTLPTPLDEAVSKEVDQVVECWRKWRVATAERRNTLLRMRTHAAMRRMGEAGMMMDAELLIQRLAEWDWERASEPLAPDDKLYPAFQQFIKFYQEATEAIDIEEPNWGVPTTKDLKAEIEALE